MSQTKSEQGGSETKSTSSDNLESQYRDIGISAVSAAAAYCNKGNKSSQKT